MITMTREAATLITTLVGDSELPASAGLRVDTDPRRGSLAMSLRPRPRRNDVVVDHEGALLFVAPALADKLADQTLQAQLQDRPAFYLTT